jgi:DNA-directed RNA polymerase subunit H (RpoH/RPB5)
MKKRVFFHETLKQILPPHRIVSCDGAKSMYKFMKLQEAQLLQSGKSKER